MEFFKKLLPKTAIPPELISMHIPKTAGTSFAEILKAAYHHTNVGSLHIQHLDDDAPLRIIYQDQHYVDNLFVNHSKVLHGHFDYLHIQEIIQPPPATPIITWLRHPVDRVISSFKYVDKIYREELSNSHPRLNILNSLKRNLMEYACNRNNINLIAQHMEGSQLGDFHFIGIVEHFEEDMAYLAQLMDWKNYAIPHLNKTAPRSPLPSDRREKIKLANQEDMEIYEQALVLRKERKRLA